MNALNIKKTSLFGKKKKPPQHYCCGSEHSALDKISSLMQKIK
jgi:hypothetical protein